MNNYPTSFKISKGKPLITEKRYFLKDLGFEYDIPLYRNVQYNISKYVLEEKIKNVRMFYGYNFETEYIQTLISEKNYESTARIMYDKARKYITYEEFEAWLDARCLWKLSPEIAENVVDEFEYLIRTLMPRDFNDLVKYLGMEYRTCYVIFFEIARKKTGIARVISVKYGIKERIIRNELLCDIYKSTCLCKVDLNEAVSFLLQSGELGQPMYNRLIIEKYLFSRSNVYKKNIAVKDCPEVIVDFAVYDEVMKPVRFIVYDVVTHLCFNEHIHKSQKRFQQLKKQDEKLSKYCKQNNIELLRLESYYFGNGRCEILQKKNCAELIEIINQHRLFALKLEIAAINNRKGIEASEKCGCFFCESIFAPKDIVVWEVDTAICPFCEFNTVIGDGQGFNITQEFIEDCSKVISDFSQFDNLY